MQMPLQTENRKPGKINLPATKKPNPKAESPRLKKTRTRARARRQRTDRKNDGLNHCEKAISLSDKIIDDKMMQNHFVVNYFVFFVLGARMDQGEENAELRTQWRRASRRASFSRANDLFRRQ